MSHDLPLLQVSAGYQWTPQEREPWMADALCAQSDPDAFFPEVGVSAEPAKKVCAECTVREQCLAYALERDEKFGIWGGLSAAERRKLKAGAA